VVGTTTTTLLALRWTCMPTYEARMRLITGVSHVRLAPDTHTCTTPVRRGVRRRRRHRTRLNRRTPLVGRSPPRRHARRGPLRALGFFIIYFKMLTKKIPLLPFCVFSFFFPQAPPLPHWFLPRAGKLCFLFLL